MKNVFLFLFALTSCISSTTIVDNDDMYFDAKNRDTIIVKRYIRPKFNNTVYYNRDLGWYGMDYYNGYMFDYHRPRTIIVVPNNNVQYNYGKRPSREGHVPQKPSNSRRGRN